ncbi:MAG: hypothetical protein ICV77_16185 [Cyanobacteria bacterium Co-bin8]|nr:hypothetical protein [Cyanobacteria bacterium Co-bin8]
MPKITTINISHRATSFDQAAIERAFKWLSDQMTAADLATCDHLNASVNVDANTRLDFNMYTELEQGQQS